MDIPFSQAYKVLLEEIEQEIIISVRTQNARTVLCVSYDESETIINLFFPLKEEFGQYDLYLFCNFLALPVDNEIYHCTF